MVVLTFTKLWSTLTPLFNVQELERARACAAVRALVRLLLPIVAGVCVLWVDGPVLFADAGVVWRMVRHRCRCGCCVEDPF